jgi:hypothetical protein
VRGLNKNLSHELMRVNLLASKGDGFHVDTLDLYSARKRAAFVKQAAAEMALDEETLRSLPGNDSCRKEMGTGFKKENAWRSGGADLTTPCPTAVALAGPRLCTTNIARKRRQRSAGRKSLWTTR